MTPSITETQVFTALRAFILGLVDCEVIRLPTNRVAMPVGEFIGLSPLSNVPLSTNVTSQLGEVKSVLRPAQFTIQVDCYGASANDRATTITTLFRDDYGCEVLAASSLDIQPLYASDARQTPLVDGESQYVERWTFELHCQINPVLTMAQPAATELEINPVTGFYNVDRTFPP